MAGPGQHWPDVAACSSYLEAQRTPLRRPYRAKQGRNCRQAWRGPGEDLETLVWHPTSPNGSRPRLLCNHQQGKIQYLHCRTQSKIIVSLWKKTRFCTYWPTICTMSEINVGCEMCAFKVIVNFVFFPSTVRSDYTIMQYLQTHNTIKMSIFLVFWEFVTH